MNKKIVMKMQQIVEAVSWHYGYQLMLSIGVVTTASMLLAGCSASMESSDVADATMSKASTEYASTDEIYESTPNSAETTVVTEDAAGGKTGAESGVVENVNQSNRKLIKNVDMDVETEEYDILLSNVQVKIEKLGGYVENLSTGEDASNSDSESRNRYATITAKVPAEKVDQFVTAVSDISNVVRKNENVSDVTLQYVDLESHKKMLLTEEKRLLELLEEAESVEDIIAIEGRLSEVRYQIDSMESQLKTLDNQINYSTVTIYIAEVNRLTPTEDKGTWEKISSGFVENVYRVGRGCKSFVIGFLINLPIIIVVAVIGIILFLLVRFVIKKNRKWTSKLITKKNVNLSQIQIQKEENLSSPNNEMGKNETSK